MRTPGRSRRAATGRLSLSGGGRAAYGSSLERDWLIALQFDWRVRLSQVEPFTIEYEVQGKRRRYTPDIAATFDDNLNQWVVIYEVKPRETLRREWHELKPKFKAALADCRANGWKFRIVTEREIRTPFVENAKFLRRFLDHRKEDLHAKALLITLKSLGPTTPQALLAATWYDQASRLIATAELWRLIATRTVAADLRRPLTMGSSIWLPES